MFLPVFVCLLSVAAARHVPLVVGGEDADVGEWPWQGSLQYSSGSHTCGCSLISERYLVTAAHCVGAGPTSLQVVLGMHDRFSDVEGDPTTYKISTITKHPDYLPSGAQGYPNDIALIYLSSDVDFTNEFVETVEIAPNDDNDYVDEECWITGWGLTQGGGSLARILQEAEVGVLTNVECATRVGASLVNPGHICIMAPEGVGIGGCSGDSGGPLSCKRDGTWYLVGAASWVMGLCNTNYPTAYTRVSYFHDWIIGETGEL